MDNYEKDIALISQKLIMIEEYISKDREHFKQHVDSAQSYRDRVILLEEKGHSFKKEFDRHCTVDMWLFGLIITIGLFIVGKLYF